VIAKTDGGRDCEDRVAASRNFRNESRSMVLDLVCCPVGTGLALLLS
jgi:hypothetical protein